MFGRHELIEEIVDLVDSLTPIALVGSGGIGKTSIALAVLHNPRIKQRFGGDRRFIRCDQFPASHTHFLARLSKVIGADFKNLEDFAPLRPFISSREMFIVLDNAESILDPEGTDAQDIYATVEELSQFDNICLCITSRISTIPPDCKMLDVPTLSMEAARDAFHRIYKKEKRSDAIDEILEQLDFHPLSVTLLATVAFQHKWDAGRLTREWEGQRTAVLRTGHKKSLADAIELSLTSPMFQELGSDARALLEVVAFFPQGVDENNLDWLFPTIPNRKDVFNKFCILSLTYRNNGFATMLAPLRDHLRPKDPELSPLLCATGKRYFSRVSVDFDPDKPEVEDTRWITSEDVNVEHLLDVFTSIDINPGGFRDYTDSNDSGGHANSGDALVVWNACAGFLHRLAWYKPRLTVLGPRLKELPNDHPSKLECLVGLAEGVDSLGNHSECRQLITHTLELYRERGDELMVAEMLVDLAETNLASNRFAEGIPQAKEASEIFKRLGCTARHVQSLHSLAYLFARDGQADAAEETLSRAISLYLGEHHQFHLCEHFHVLGQICISRGQIEAAIIHHEKALRIATSLNFQAMRVMVLNYLVGLFLKLGRLDNAQVHLEHLKSDAIGDLKCLALAMVIQVCVYRQQGRFDEAESEISRFVGVCQKTGVSADFLECWQGFLRDTEEKVNNPVTC